MAGQNRAKPVRPLTTRRRRETPTLPSGNRTPEMEALCRISEIILTSQNPKADLHGILSRLLTIGSFEAGWILLLDPTGEILETVASQGDRRRQGRSYPRGGSSATGAAAWGSQALEYPHAIGVENVSAMPEMRGIMAEGVQSAIVAPIRIKERSLGVIFLGSRKPRKFRPRQVQFFEMIGNQIGVAIQNMRLFEETRRHLGRARVLHEVGLAVASTLELDSVLKLFFEKIDLVLPAAVITVQIFDERTQTLEPVASHNQDEGMWEHKRWEGAAGLAKTVHETKRPLIVSNFQSHLEGTAADHGDSKQELVSYLGFPLLVKGRNLGVISFYTRERHDSGGDEVGFFEALVAQLAIAVHNAQLHDRLSEQTRLLQRSNEELKIRSRQQAVIAYLGELALARKDLSELLQGAAMLVAQTLKVQYCKVLELLPPGNTLLLRAGVGWKDGLLGKATLDAGTESQGGYTLLKREPVLVEDFRIESRFNCPALLRDHGITAGMSVVILRGDRAFGVLGVHTTEPRKFSQDDAHFLQSAANVLAAAIAGFEANEALRNSERRFETLARVSPVGIFQANDRGDCVYANEQCGRIMGLKREALYGQGWRRALHREDRQRVLRQWRQLSRTEAPFSSEYRFEHSDGSVVWVYGQVVALMGGDGEMTGYVGTVTDISERKRLEDQILEIAAVERKHFGQDLHDGLGQHLTGIALMAKGLQRSLARKSMAEASEALRIANLTDQAIDCTRGIARGMYPMELEADGLTAAMQGLASNAAGLFHVSCSFECNDPFLVPSNSVATHLYRIAQEAVNNAIRHGRARNVWIALSRANGKIILTVTDDGVGFTKQDSGGMGLHIMKYRAQAIHGDLEVNQRQGGGTVVRCLL